MVEVLFQTLILKFLVRNIKILIFCHVTYKLVDDLKFFSKKVILNFVVWNRLNELSAF